MLGALSEWISSQTIHGKTFRQLSTSIGVSESSGQMQCDCLPHGLVTGHDGLLWNICLYCEDMFLPRSLLISLNK